MQYSPEEEASMETKGYSVVQTGHERILSQTLGQKSE